MENDKNCSRDHLVGFGGKINSFWVGFKVGKFWEHQKWQSFDQNIFGPYWWRAIRIAPPKTCGDFFWAKLTHSKLVWKFGEDQMWQSFDRNIFGPYWWRMIRTAPQIMWPGFGDKTYSLWVVWKFGKFGKFWVDQKWQSFHRNIFGPYWWRTIITIAQMIQRGFGGETNPLWVGLKVWEVLKRPKVTKFWPEYFLAVLIESDKNCRRNL